jgi:hypothetical protein
LTWAPFSRRTATSFSWPTYGLRVKGVGVKEVEVKEVGVKEVGVQAVGIFSKQAISMIDIVACIVNMGSILKKDSH